MGKDQYSSTSGRNEKVYTSSLCWNIGTKLSLMTLSAFRSVIAKPP